ncbi:MULTISPECIES: hypothetical protein [unclassified Exiguobacterium]|uniref:hypothetical protein n=1 Tax=unclassified Exiguobacterium TaxID=2644629 RepID=UPI00069AF544|nr:MULTISPECIES: hypothetical protein [unclassified Exiguobacterium]
MTHRFLVESRDIYSFMNPMLVICPRCGGQADVWEKNDEVRLSCLHCSHLQTKESGAKYIGEAIDVHYSLPLFLQTGCCGDVLWTYNREHLNYIKDYIEAKIRTSEGTNRSFESRLPAWMKSKQNRKDVLRAIEKLELMIEGPTA